VTAGPSGGWVVWRQDDDGNRYVVARLPELAPAQALADEMEARGHRQVYLVAREQPRAAQPGTGSVPG
jgi:hypothetical protein